MPKIQINIDDEVFDDLSNEAKELGFENTTVYIETLLFEAWAVLKKGGRPG